MKFIDEIRITVQSGNGGAGCVSLRREKYIPKGGPDGGDGGRGGNVILKATTKKRTLYHLQFRKLYKAENGSSGQGRNRTGRSGGDLIIELPAGTLVIEMGVMAADEQQAGTVVPLRMGESQSANGSADAQVDGLPSLGREDAVGA